MLKLKKKLNGDQQKVCQQQNKKEQQRKLWYDGYLSDREFVDWLLVHGDDSDVEWLSTQLDEDFDAPTDPANDNT